MKFAFSLLNYFPFGGLERDFMAISEECLERGHSIDVYTMSWQGARPVGLNVCFLEAKGFTNHGRIRAFHAALQGALQTRQYDLLVGFNKIPELDVYYAADVCYEARIRRQRSFLSRFTPRYQVLAAFEQEIFAPASATDIIYLAGQEKRNYQGVYQTPDQRFYYGPPGVDVESIRSQLGGQARQEVRAELGLAAHDALLLMIGSNFHTKGVARSIEAVAALPSNQRRRCQLVVIGRGKEQAYKKLARRLGVARHLRFLGGRDDVPRFLAAADILLQPSLIENTGNAIVEAMVAGVPVLATETCGYSEHVVAADCGKVVGCVPFRQAEMNEALADMIASPHLATWQENALRYCQENDMGSRPQVVATILEELATKRGRA